MESDREVLIEAMLRDARPAIDRVQGVRELEALGFALRDAEDAPTWELNAAETAWSRADDLMESVCRSPDAMVAARDMGFVASGFGYPLLTERGTAFCSRELLDRIAEDRGLDR